MIYLKNIIRKMNKYIVEKSERKYKKLEIKEMETKITQLTAEKEANMGGEMKSLSEKVDALSQNLVRETSVLNNKEDTLRSEEANKANVCQ